MVNFMKRIPAGTFLIPMLLSALLYTIAPSLFQIGGVTEALLGGESVSFIIGMITFTSGINVDLNVISKLLKRHGSVFLSKIVLSIVLSLIYMSLFGQSGIFGVSALAFTIAMSSINPALYISLIDDHGDDVDAAAFVLASLFSIPALPMLIYALGSGGSVDWMPIISIIIPLILGVILGNLDPNFRDLFAGGVPILLPILGWNIGQGMNLLVALRSGISGIILAIMYYALITIPMVFIDRRIKKDDGIVAVSLNSVAGSASAFPLIIAAANPIVGPYVDSASAQVLTVALITVILTPIASRMLIQQRSNNNESF
jgi:2-keto-3-deoxygluconate permease